MIFVAAQKLSGRLECEHSPLTDSHSLAISSNMFAYGASRADSNLGCTAGYICFVVVAVSLYLLFHFFVCLFPFIPTVGPFLI